MCVSVVVIKPVRGRGRTKSGKGKQQEFWPGRSGASGSVMSIASSPSQSQSSSFHEGIPAAAKLTTDEDVLWVNNRGDVKAREVVGNRVFLRQQPHAPPPVPQILLLTDQMMAKFQTPDKYIEAKIMPGYDLKDFTNDVKDDVQCQVPIYFGVFRHHAVGSI